MQPVPRTCTTIEVPHSVDIVKFTIPLDLCEEIKEKAAPYLNADISCNLHNTSRTGWSLHQEEGFTQTFEKFWSEVAKNLGSYASSPGGSAYELSPSRQLQMSYSIVDMWVAAYSEDSFVAPHRHSYERLFARHYALSAYIDATKNGTHLSFYDNFSQSHANIRVSTGDVLVFPANLVHYTNDCKDGRAILSSNFIPHFEVVDK